MHIYIVSIPSRWWTKTETELARIVLGKLETAFHRFSFGMSFGGI